MHALRRAAVLARLVLAWFVLTLGVAVASPLVRPPAVEWVCSGAGMVKMLVTSADGTVLDRSTGGMDCALCLPTGAPPPMDFRHPPPPRLQPLGESLRSIPAARLAAATAAPPPARGPPIEP
jgi:hypothetical protein